MEEVTHLEGMRPRSDSNRLTFSQFTRQIIGSLLDQPRLILIFPFPSKSMRDSAYGPSPYRTCDALGAGWSCNLICENAWQHAYRVQKGFQQRYLFADHTGTAEVLLSGLRSGIQSGFDPKTFLITNQRCSDSQGSGIGLYLVRELVHRMKGLIGCSQPGHEGTVLGCPFTCCEYAVTSSGIGGLFSLIFLGETEGHNLNLR